MVQNNQGQRGYQQQRGHTNGRQGGNRENQTRIIFVVGAPAMLVNGNYEVESYAVVKKADGSLVDDGHQVNYHSDDLQEVFGKTKNGRIDFKSEISAFRAGQKITLTCHTIMDNRRFDKSIPVQLPTPKKVDIRLIASKPRRERNKLVIEIEAITTYENGKVISRPLSFYDENLKKLASVNTDVVKGKTTYIHRLPLNYEGKTIVIRVQIDNTNVEKSISIEIPTASMKIIPSTNLIALGGGEIQFQTKFDLPVNVYWHVVDFGRDTGNIDAHTGLYKAPEIIPIQKTVKIEAIDRNRPDNKAQAEITLLPVEMKAGTQRKIHAGEKDVELEITSHNDLSGLYNFTYAIVSHPMVGRILENNKYTPPLVISSPKTVKVKATSKLDKSKSVILEFDLDLPLCRVCKGITNSVGRCTICNMPRSYGASLR